MELLTDGKNAFPEIINCIRNARSSIYINMFIWRNDSIGSAIAREVLAAADRGVKIVISKDRYGVICESCEENRLSFFNRSPSFSEKVKIFTLSCLYNRESLRMKSDADTDGGALLKSIEEHPGITLDCGRNKYDHSKFYIFDNETVITGGINIEDKENGQDFAGRRYHDYMVKITEAELVRDFIGRRVNPMSDNIFGMNVKSPSYHFGMKEEYLNLIDSAEKYLTIVMAYFSPLPEFEKAILAAADRVENLNIVIPAKANFQNDLNMKTVKRLVNKSGNKIRVYLYPGMLHAKLLISEKTISLGSCNITKKAFGQLDELNVFAGNTSSSFAESVRKSVDDTLSASALPDGNIKYNPVMAALESILV